MCRHKYGTAIAKKTTLGRQQGLLREGSGGKKHDQMTDYLYTINPPISNTEKQHRSPLPYATIPYNTVKHNFPHPPNPRT